MRGRSAAVLGAVALGVLLTPAHAATVDVRVGSYYFEDATADDGRITVEAGDRITFVFEGTSDHTATVDGQFDSGRRTAPQTFTTSPLTRVGTYTLYCDVHGPMVHGGTLVVQAKQPGTSPKPSPTRAASPAASPSPAPTRSSPVASRSAAASRSPAAPSPSNPVATVIPAPTLRSASPVPPPPSSPTVGPTSSPDALAADGPAAPSDDDGFDRWLLIPLAVLLLLAALGATMMARRRRTP